jgi:hypothetical protein
MWWTAYRRGVGILRGTLLLLSAAAGFLAATGGTHAAVSSTLYAGFDADGNIHLNFADGTMIGTPTPPGTLVPSGTYTIMLNNNGLDDEGGQHFFHLSGPGVNLDAAGNLYDTATWTATFQPGATYVYQDDNNPNTSREIFGTPGSGAGATTATTPTTTPTVSTQHSTTTKATSQDVVGSALVPFRGTLLGSVSAAGKLTLTLKGKAVASLKTGRYTITVSDHSGKNGFTLQEIRQPGTTITTTTYVGKRSATLTLKPGQWFFYPSFVGKKTYFIVTA